jgi:7-carboxy-7-deazaguanine synthase
MSEATEILTEQSKQAERVRRFPVVEVFGPTIQGEGPEAGLPCCFVRFGGCDYRCSWCDSMYAVEPAEVRKAERLTTSEIMGRLPDVQRVILSGGNPALLELGELVTAMHLDGRTVSVETQGSRWKDWLWDVDCLVISPKPPSSRMGSLSHEAETSQFMRRALGRREEGWREREHHQALKIVVFGELDYKWAREFHVLHSDLPFFLSVGTMQQNRWVSQEEMKLLILERFKWLCERVAEDPVMSRARVLPQLHVLAWGTLRGV